MILLRLSSSLTLWGSAVALTICGVMTAAHGTALDARRPTAALWILGALLVGHLLRRALGPRDDGAFGGDRHALCVVVAGCALLGMSQVDGQTSLSSIREAVPPLFTWLYPTLVAVCPLLLARRVGGDDVGDQALSWALFLTALDGALCLLPAAGGAALAACALTATLATNDTRLAARRSTALLGMLAFAVAMTIAAAHGVHRIDARPAWTWIVASTLLGLTVAARDRSTADWRRVLAAPTAAAVIVALCTALLVVQLALDVHPGAALRTRLTMFRQHPNFLAPFFALHAVFALGLALSARRGRMTWGLAALLLGVATVHTDSNAGRAALLLGAALVPGLFVVRRVLARLPRAVVLAIAATLVVGAGVVGVLLIGGADASSSGLGTGLDRVARSLDYRLDAWRNSAAVISSSPWIGVGPNTHLSMFAFEPGSRYFNDPTSPHPHNVLLYVAQAGGLIALAAAAVWIVALAVALWRRFAAAVDGRDELPASLVSAVLAGGVGLAVANAVDLGLSLMTVVPAPLFVLTGLVARRHGDAWAPRLGPAALVAGALVLFTAGTSWRPLWARTRARQAQLHVLETSFGVDRETAVTRARRAMDKALANDPTLPGAHDLLSRWLESAPQGFHRAHDVLERLVELTPCDARSHGLLAQLFKRNGMHRQAADAFGRSLDAPRGHGERNRDRADRIWCLAQEGEREAALVFLVEALRLDRGVVQHIPWRGDAAGRRTLPIRAGGQLTNDPPITLIEAAERLYARHLEDEQAGRPVGRRFWMDTYNAFRDAGRDDRALDVLESLERSAPDVLAGEPWTYDNERGKIALDAGDLDGARTLFMSAYDKTVAAGQPISFFFNQAMKIGGDEAVADEPGGDAPSFGDIGQILDMHPVYTDHFRASRDDAAARGDPAAAAEAARRLLLFTDDVLARVELLADAAALSAEAGDVTQVHACVAQALDDLAAKPFPAMLLQRDEHRSLPGELAHTFARSLFAAGFAPDDARRRAWGLPHFFSSRTGPSLFRLAFLQETAQVDGLLKESELLLRIDPTNLMAMWGRVVALEGLGRWREADESMRALAEHFGGLHAPERLIADYVASVDHRADDPEVWLRVAVLKLLQGYYADAAGLFARGREHAGGDAALEAELAQWQARAALYAGMHDEARAALGEAVTLDPLRPMLARRLEVMP